jgi:hypothetical protein
LAPITGQKSEEFMVWTRCMGESYR